MKGIIVKIKNRYFLWGLFILFLLFLICVLFRYFTSIFILFFLIVWIGLIFMWVCALLKGELVETAIAKELIIRKKKRRGVTISTYFVEFVYARKPNSKVKAESVFLFRKNAEKFIGQRHALAYYLFFNKREQLVLKEGLVRNILLNCFVVIPALIYLVIVFLPYTVDSVLGIIDFFV